MTDSASETAKPKAARWVTYTGLVCGSLAVGLVVARILKVLWFQWWRYDDSDHFVIPIAHDVIVPFGLWCFVVWINDRFIRRVRDRRGDLQFDAVAVIRFLPWAIGFSGSSIPIFWDFVGGWAMLSFFRDPSPPIRDPSPPKPFRLVNHVVRIAIDVAISAPLVVAGWLINDVLNKVLPR